MKLLVFSDVHTDFSAAENLVKLSSLVDVVLGAGDFCSMHENLESTIKILSKIKKPFILVPGNNETTEDLKNASSDFPNIQVLHGSGINLKGFNFWGLGGGVPETPWDWSFDLSESKASEMLQGCKSNSILIVHSPPKGHVDGLDGNHFGSFAILDCVKRKNPSWVFCGHIHECWEKESMVGETRILNCGPKGRIIEV